MINNVSYYGGQLFVGYDSNVEFKSGLIYFHDINYSSENIQSIFIEQDDVLEVSYSNIQGGIDGDFNIDLNPLLCPINNAIITLAENSPCIEIAENGGNIGGLEIGCSQISPVLGCTDNSANNFNSQATLNDNSCTYDIFGCTSSFAINYDYNANIDDWSCLYSSFTYDFLQNQNTDLHNININLNNTIDEATSSISSLQHALDTWNTTIDLSAGWNMFGYGCPSSINVTEGLSNHTESIIITKDNNGNVYMPEFGFNGIGDFTPGFGYQIKITEAIEDFSLCDWYVNDIPEDNIVSLQDSIDILREFIDLECVNQGACSFNIEISECVFAEEGYDCEGNFSPELGDYIEGGIVFYLDSTTQHGLVVALHDLPDTYQWGCLNIDVVGANDLSIGSGLQNTLDIVNQGCIPTETEGGGVSAAQAALDYETDGYTDWYLPSLNELEELYYSITGFTVNTYYGECHVIPNIDSLILNISNGFYWSSSQHFSTHSHGISFLTASSFSSYRANASKVRPIRSF